MAGETALGCLVADIALVPIVLRAHGRKGGLVAGAVLAPMLVKRVLGNEAPAHRRPEVYLWRLLFDRDSPGRPRAAARSEEGR